MKRIGYFLCAVCLLLSVSACTQTGDAYSDGMEQLKIGNYEKAYAYLKESSDPRAAEELERLVFVPLREDSTASFDSGKNTQNYRQYAYDANGNLISEESLFEGTKSLTEYTYNDKNWLMTVKSNDRTQTYTYDEAGNRLTYERNHIEAGVYREKYLYDEQNSLIKTIATFEDGQKLILYPQEEVPPPVVESGRDCTYDDAGRLLTETYPNGEKREYAYDEHGNKITERYTGNGTVTESQYQWVLQYYPDGMSEPVKELREQTIQTQPVA